MIEFKKIYEDLSHVELFIDGVSKGVFTTPKKAEQFIQKYVSNNSNSDIVSSESSGVSQKNDEPIVVKRRGRPKKADNERGKLPSIR